MSRWVTWSDIFERIPLAVAVKIDLGRGFKSGNGETSWKAIEIIQERDFSGLDYSGNSREGKKRLDSGYLLNVEPIWFLWRLDMVDKREEQNMTDRLSFWATRRMKFAIKCDGEDWD